MNPIDQERITRPSLLLRVRSGSDQLAWHEFVEIYGPMIFGFCRFRKLQESDAADVTQDVLVRLSKAMPSFEYQPELGRFRDWLGKVVYRELLRHWSKEKKHETVEPMDHSVTAHASSDSDWSDFFQSEILRLSFERIRGEFEPETIQIFELAWSEDLPATEVAQKLKTSVDKVYVAKSRVLKRLRQEVVRLTEDLPVAGM
jgi:RNA polymerase sigma factor (sigma-70 family)